MQSGPAAYVRRVCANVDSSLGIGSSGRSDHEFAAHRLFCPVRCCSFYAADRWTLRFTGWSRLRAPKHVRYRRHRSPWLWTCTSVLGRGRWW